MIPTNRKPKSVTKKLSTPSPGLNGTIETKRLNKTDLLSKFHDPIENYDDDIFGDEEGLNFDEDFNTLRINDIDTLKLPQNTISSKKSIKFEENEFELDGFDDLDENLNLKDHFLERSPIDSISTSSPKSSLYSRMRDQVQVTRKPLSEYSEDDDTDITSQMNEDDFEDLDNIFGAEEQGIYDKINQKLIAKKLKLQREAELEEMELQKDYQRLATQNSAKDLNATLKLKDFGVLNGGKTLTNQNLSLLDQLENEKTINYEYTRDDFEDFADGFDSNFEKKLGDRRSRPMKNKVSMPTLSKSQPSTIKKYKSTMDIARKLDLNGEEQDSPAFNYDDNVIRKLDRIPSFYNRKPSQSDVETTRKKQQLLNKYTENSKDKKKGEFSRGNGGSSKHKIGLVKYLNNNSVISNPIIPTHSKSMRYDAQNKRWKGNEADLLRFESMHKPSLITSNDIKVPKNHERFNVNSTLKRADLEDKTAHNPNMVYDNENLRWINLNDENETLFNDIPDLVDFDTPKGADGRYHPQEASKAELVSPPVKALQSPMRRGLSQFTQRTVSSNTNTTSSVDDDVSDEFKIPSKLIDKFVREEEKIKKKTCHWFSVNEAYDVAKNTDTGFNREYYWEIRKMVIDND